MTLNDQIKVSIIIPFYNREEYISRTLNSLLLVDYFPLEIIFVDNNSADLTSLIIQQYLPFFHQKGIDAKMYSSTIQGAAAARNVGLRFATGDYVYFFDSDDEFDANYLRSIKRYFGYYDLIVSPTNLIINNQIKIRYQSKKTNIIAHIIASTLSTQSMTIRKTKILSIGGWCEEALCWNDWELGVRLLLSNPSIKTCHKSYHKIYKHADSITGTSYSSTFKLWWKTMISVENKLSTKSQIEAIIVRYIIFAGCLFREGDLYSYNKVMKHIEIDKLSLKMKLLHYYVKYFGKGAWFIYLKLLRYVP